jgi:hypothetical protein
VYIDPPREMQKRAAWIGLEEVAEPAAATAG